MSDRSENDRLRHIFEWDQTFGPVVLAVRGHLDRVAAVAVLVGAWAVPVHLAVTGISWTRGGGRMIRSAPLGWQAADAWSTTTLWVGAAFLAALASVRVAYAWFRKKETLAAAVRLSSGFFLVEWVWALTALIFINVIYNALVMAP